MKTKLSLTNIVVLLLVLAVVALTVCLFQSDAPKAPAPVAPQPAAAAKAEVPEVPGAVERALRKRIRQLEAELAALRAGPQAATNGPARPEMHAMPKPSEMRPPNPREWMEDMRKNDPKRYAEFKKRVERMRQRHLQRTQNRLEFLGSIDTTGMSKEERANHEKLQELLAQRENQPSPEDLTEEEMRESMKQRANLDRAIRQASAAERTALLKQTAGALGLEGDDAAVLTDTLQEVIRATESDHHGPHGPPPM